MDSKEKKDKGIAVAATIVVHALAVLVLVLMAFKTPTPLPAEEGVEVNLGSSNEGLGETQSEKLASPKKASTPPQTKQETSKSEEENITDDNSENQPINESNKTKTKTEPKQEKKTEQTQPKIKKGSLYESSNNNDTEESSESENDLTKLTTSQGNTKGSGDQGKINGSKDSNNYDGNGGKGKVNFGFDGNRGVTNRKLPNNDFDHVGNIAVDIYINSKGEVERAELNRKNTSITETTPGAQKMKQEAIEAARKWCFKPDPNAHELEHCTITFFYTLN